MDDLLSEQGEMPKMHGIELYVAIRGYENYAITRLILLKHLSQMLC